MTEIPNMNKIIRACYDLNQDWNKELNEMQSELDHSREVAEEYINIKDQEIAELKRKLEEEKRRRQEAERGTENFKKHRKELLNLVMDIHCRHRHGSNLKMLEDHLHKLIVSMTNLYDSIPDIYEDLTRIFNFYDLIWYIDRAQYGINYRIKDGRRGRVTKVNVTPTIHHVGSIKHYDLIRTHNMINYNHVFLYEEEHETEAEERCRMVHKMTRKKYKERERRQIQMIERNLALTHQGPRG